MQIQIQDLGPEWLNLTPDKAEALRTKSMAGVPVLTDLADAQPCADVWSTELRTEVSKAIAKGLGSEVLKAQGKTSAALQTLIQPGSLAVITGQQPGFLCSPLYSLIKAMQACRLAQELQTKWRRPVVALFWNHADDHDVAEVNHTYIQNRNLDLQKVTLSGLASGKRPLSNIHLDHEGQGLGAIQALLEQNFGMYPHCQEALDLLMPKDGETLPAAMTRILTEWLGEHGLVVIEPDWIRKPLSMALAQVVSSDLAQALAEGNADGSIEAHSAAILFEIVQGERHALRLHADGFVFDQTGATIPPEELATRIRNSPDCWSPGALLRPLVQDMVLPVYGYVGGLGELAYHAQIPPARRASGAPQTVFIPRVSVTLVDEECSASLKKSGLTLLDILGAKGEFEIEEVEGDTPAAITEVQDIVREAQEKLRAKRSALAEIEPSLETGLRRAADQMASGVEKLLAKALRIHQNKGGKEKRHIRRLNHRLMPRGLPQERVLGPLEFYTRYGPDWVRALYDAVPPVCASHLAMNLTPDRSSETTSDDNNQPSTQETQ